MCGHTKLDPQPHYEICDFIDRAIAPLLKPPFHYVDPFTGSPMKTADLVMVPRDHFKTTIGAVDTSILAIKHNPNITILLDAHTSEHSEESLDGIKSIIESEDFIEAHGDWKRGANNTSADFADRWARGSITVAQRTQIGLREPTITCTGVDQSKVGGHYDLIIADDLANEKNTQSEVLREKTRRRLGQYTPLLKTGGVLLMLGTHWHKQDIYMSIRAEDLKRANTCAICRKQRTNHAEATHTFIGTRERFRKLIRRIWTDDGRPYFPSRFPPEAIEQLRMDLTEDEFAKWYLNEPIADSSRLFHPSYFKFFDGSFSVDDFDQPYAHVVPQN